MFPRDVLVTARTGQAGRVDDRFSKPSPADHSCVAPTNLNHPHGGGCGGAQTFFTLHDDKTDRRGRILLYGKAQEASPQQPSGGGVRHLQRERPERVRPQPPAEFRPGAYRAPHVCGTSAHPVLSTFVRVTRRRVVVFESSNKSGRKCDCCTRMFFFFFRGVLSCTLLSSVSTCR